MKKGILITLAVALVSAAIVSFVFMGIGYHENNSLIMENRREAFLEKRKEYKQITVPHATIIYIKWLNEKDRHKEVDYHFGYWWCLRSYVAEDGVVEVGRFVRTKIFEGRHGSREAGLLLPEIIDDSAELIYRCTNLENLGSGDSG